MASSKNKSSIRGEGHPYYCNEFCWESNHHTRWPSWKAFYEEFGDADADMNFVWRFDWILPDPDDSEDCRASEHLMIFMIKQRKGFGESHEIKATSKDEPAVKAWLASKAAAVAALWPSFLEVK